MPVVSVAPPPEPSDQLIVLRRLSWDLYAKMNDQLGEGRNPRLIFCDGTLTIVVTSRRHDWFAERLGQLVVALAEAMKMLWEDAGHFVEQMRSASELGASAWHIQLRNWASKLADRPLDQFE